MGRIRANSANEGSSHLRSKWLLTKVAIFVFPRMALLSALPGTALIPGLALAKKQTHDSRTTEVVITGSNWHSTVRINPNDLSMATAVVNRINSAANAQVSPPASSHQSKVAENTSENQEKSLAAQLSSLNELFKSGALSESEFQAAKNKILDN